MKNRTPSHPPLVWLLIVLQFLLGLGAVGGGGALMAFPDGDRLMMPISMLQYTPFTSFFIPGLILLTFVGLFPLAVAYSLWVRPAWRWPDVINPFKMQHWSWAASLAAGVILIIWILVEVFMLRSIAFLHVLYFVWGVALVLLTLAPAVKRRYSLR